MPASTKALPFRLVVGPAQVLTGALVAYGGALLVADLQTAVLSIDYTRDGGSATGRPFLRVSVSRDPPETPVGTVGNWQPAQYLLDAASYVPATGAINATPAIYQLQFTAAGTQTFGTPDPIDVSAFVWMQVELADADGVNAGTVDVYLGGTVAS